MHTHCDLLIIGGGVLGTFHAYHALERGLRVAILERSKLPQGSSVQNFGQIVPSGMDAKWQQYGRKSLEIYKSIQSQFDISLRQNGSVYLASNDEEMTLLEELAAINRANDYPSKLLSAGECLQRYEGLRTDYCRGALFFPEEVTLEPRVAVHRILSFLIEQKGLHYHPEALAAFLCINFILSSGFVKTIGKWMMLDWGVSEFWMPFAVAMLFLPPLLIGLWVLEHLPSPSPEDIEQRTQRQPMTRATRKQLFRAYAPGLVILVVIYLVLTILRDVRDNFTVEIWAELGFGGQPTILTTAELPVALLVLGFVGALALIKKNDRALWVNHAIIVAGAMMMMAATLMFQTGYLSPVIWMILSGAGVFLPYILFNGVIFERLLAAFRETGNVGFLIYIADSIGYLGSVLVLLWRNFGRPDLSWVQFFSSLCLYGALLIFFTGMLSWAYFRFKYKRVSVA